MAAAGKPGVARKAFALAKTADPGNLEASLALAQLDLMEGDMAAARQSLAGLPASAGDTATVQLLWGGVELKAGNHQAAIEHYRKVLESDPNRVLALNNLASLLSEYANQPDEALKYAQRAKELAPASPEVGGTIGWIYYRRGIYATALEYFRDAVKLDAAATSANAVSRRYYLGLTYLKLGNLPQGLEILQQALKMHPEVPEAELARAAIRQASKTSGQ
jgi:Tfp pilus assembly protein PilF